VVAIGQPSHSWVSGQLARAWGNERFGALERYEEVCLAAEQHDLGMGPWDADPERNPHTGLPYSFTEMPIARHLQQWRDGPRRLLVQSRYASLLVSMHGSRLQRRRDLNRLPEAQAAAIRDYLTEQTAFQDALIASLEVRPEQLERHHQLLWIWDFLSLALCLDWPPITAHDVPSATAPVELELAAGDAPRRLTLAPWPFRGETLTARCEGRRLHGPYGSDEEMRRALDEAPWETIEFELAPE
jgi:uncharacterized protein DUF3891